MMIVHVLQRDRQNVISHTLEWYKNVENADASKCKMFHCTLIVSFIHGIAMILLEMYMIK